MDFNLATWQEKTTAPLKKVGQWLKQTKKEDGRFVLYGYLCGLSLWPVIEVAQSGSPLAAMTVLGSVAGSVGVNLIANQMQNWVFRQQPVSQPEITQWVVENSNNPELLQALDTIMGNLNIVPRAQAELQADDLQQFQQMLHQELAQLGNLTRYEAHLSGSGAIAQGDGAIAIHAENGGMAFNRVVGNVHINTGPQQTTEEPVDLRQAYLNRLLADCSRLSLTGIDPKAASTSQAEASLNLGAVYTALLTLSTEQHEQWHNRQRQADMLAREMRLRSALEELNQHPRLVLLGDPGSGKSTFVNFVTMCMAGELSGSAQTNLAQLTAPLPDDEGQDQKKRQPWQHGPLLPVPVILRDFAARGLPPVGQPATAEHLWHFIQTELNDAALGAYGPALGRELHQKGGLLLLDGLDEVPEADQRRTQIKQAVEDFAKSFGRCRIVVTSRTYAYQQQDWRLPNFAETVLAPFSQGQIHRFVERWYQHTALLRGLNTVDAQGRAVLLKQAIFGSDRLRGLAERPLLLTLMASLHAWRGGSLPENREELYADTVDLLLDWWESPKVVRAATGQIEVRQRSLAEWLDVDRTKVRTLLNTLAFQAHAAQPDFTGTADVKEGDLVSGLMHLSQKQHINPVYLVEFLRDRAGLLLPRGVGVYTFPHRTFQEYLAACHLTDTEYPDLVVELVQKEPNRWREVALLAGAKAARGTSSAIWQLVEALCYQEPETHYTIAAAWNALLAGQALTESAKLEQVSERNQIKIQRVQRWLVTILEQSDLPATERNNAGLALAHLGDPRPDVGLRADGLPDIAWCAVPEATFLMGNKKQASKLPAFQISRYPVTNAQYAAFVADGGYTEKWKICWTETGWREKNEREESPWIEPRLWNYPRYNQANQPVVGVSWYESVAFCRWLTLRLQEAGELRQDQEISLPGDSQWGKAAHGKDGRVYPWGHKITPDLANYDDTDIGAPSSVGCFPKGASPYGCLDMSGNVWEWCRSKDDDLNDNSLEGDADRVLRGGAFFDNGRGVRSARRYRNFPLNGHYNIGFRVVLVSPFFS